MTEAKTSEEAANQEKPRTAGTHQKAGAATRAPRLVSEGTWPVDTSISDLRLQNVRKFL